MVKSAARDSKNVASAFASASRLLNKPPRPAALRARASPIISSGLAPENHSEHEPDAERGDDRLGRIFAHVLFGIVLECARASARVAPRPLGLVAILSCHRARSRTQIVRRLPRVCLAALELALWIVVSLLV